MTLNTRWASFLSPLLRIEPLLPFLWYTGQAAFYCALAMALSNYVTELTIRRTGSMRFLASALASNVILNGMAIVGLLLAVWLSGEEGDPETQQFAMRTLVLIFVYYCAAAGGLRAIAVGCVSLRQPGTHQRKS